MKKIPVPKKCLKEEKNELCALTAGLQMKKKVEQKKKNKEECYWHLKIPIFVRPYQL